MKKSLPLLSCNAVKCALTLVASMLFCNTIIAQPESFVVKDAAANFPENTKVRYVNDTLAVGYFDDNSRGCFMLINLNNASITHKVQTNYLRMYVKDFRVLGDTVYACGRYRFLLNQKGFIMKFNINLPSDFYLNGDLFQRSMSHIDKPMLSYAHFAKSS